MTTAKKEYICDMCDKQINPGEKYLFDKGRAPTYDENDDQNGIIYWSTHLCLDQDACFKRWEENESDNQ